MTLLHRYAAMLYRSARSATAREAGIVLSGNLSSAILRFIVSVILANHTTKAEFAVLAVFMAVMDLATIAADSGLNSTMVRFVAINRKDKLRPLLWQSLVIRCVLWIAVVVIGLAAAWPFFLTQVIDAADRWMYAAAIASGIFISVAGHGMSVMQGLQRFASFAVLAVSVNTFRLGAVGAMIAYGYSSANWLFAAFFLVPVLTLPVVPIWLRTVERPSGSPGPEQSYRSLLLYMWPIGAVSLLAIVLQRADLLMLNAMSEAETVADFRVAYEIAFVFPLIARSLFTVLLPKASTMTTAAELKAYRRRAVVLYPALLALVAIAVAIGPWLLTVLFGERYATSAPVLRVLLVAFGMHIIFNPLTVILYAIERHVLVPMVHLVQLPMLIALNVWLIPIYSGMGAAIAALAIRVFGVAAMLVLTQRAIAQFRNDQPIDRESP